MRNRFRYRIAGVLFFFCFLSLSGCISERESESNQILFMNLETVTGSLLAMPDFETVPSHYQFYYIKGINLQLNGVADRWIIGVKKNNVNYFYTISSQGTSHVIWSGDFPYTQIFLDRILYPEELFQMRPLLAEDLTKGGTQKIDTIELIGDTYYITGKIDNTTKEFRFNAIDGSQIT